MISIRSPNLSRKRLLRKEPNSTGPRDPCQNGPQMLSLRSFGTLPRNWTWKDALMCPNTAHLAHREWLDAFLQQFQRRNNLRVSHPRHTADIWTASKPISPVAESVKNRYAEKVEGFIVATTTSSYIGSKNLNIPLELVQDKTGKGSADDMASRWGNFMPTTLGVRSNQVGCLYVQCWSWTVRPSRDSGRKVYGCRGVRHRGD